MARSRSDLLCLLDGEIAVCLEVFYFEIIYKHLNLPRDKKNKLFDLLDFVLIYTKIWIEAPLAADASVNDLLLWKSLKLYEAIDSEIGIAARSVLERHLWY